MSHSGLAVGFQALNAAACRRWLSARRDCATGSNLFSRPIFTAVRMLSGNTFETQFRVATGGFAMGVTGVVVGIPFASRFRRCVNRVGGAFARNGRKVVDQSVCEIHSANGPKACLQILDVSDSSTANSPVSRQFPSLCSKNHFLYNGARRNQSNRKASA